MDVDDSGGPGDERRRKERLHYDPKSFRRSRIEPVEPRRWRPGFGTVVAVVLVVCLAIAPAVGRWLGERLSTRGDVSRAR